jgi:hypothetical protein
MTKKEWFERYGVWLKKLDDPLRLGSRRRRKRSITWSLLIGASVVTMIHEREQILPGQQRLTKTFEIAKNVIAVTVVVFFTSGSSGTTAVSLPGWNNASNTIECIGGGGTGGTAAPNYAGCSCLPCGGGGGGGAGYNRTTNITLGATFTYAIAGASGTTSFGGGYAPASGGAGGGYGGTVGPCSVYGQGGNGGGGLYGGGKGGNGNFGQGAGGGGGGSAGPGGGGGAGADGGNAGLNAGGGGTSGGGWTASAGGSAYPGAGGYGATYVQAGYGGNAYGGGGGGGGGLVGGAYYGGGGGAQGIAVVTYAKLMAGGFNIAMLGM